MNEPDSPYRTRWSDAVATPAARKQMITNTMDWLDRNKFDGWVAAMCGVALLCNAALMAATGFEHVCLAGASKGFRK